MKREALVLDELTLHMVRASLDSRLRWNEEQQGFVRVDAVGEPTYGLAELLWFLSGEAESEEDPETGIDVVSGSRWSVDDLILALVIEVERLRELDGKAVE